MKMTPRHFSIAALMLLGTVVSAGGSDFNDLTARREGVVPIEFLLANGTAGI
jgi:hypothetical protein